MREGGSGGSKGPWGGSDTGRRWSCEESQCEVTLKSPQLLTSAGLFACRSRSASPSRVRAPRAVTQSLALEPVERGASHLHHLPTYLLTYPWTPKYFLIPYFRLPGNPKTPVQIMELVSSNVRAWHLLAGVLSKPSHISKASVWNIFLSFLTGPSSFSIPRT